jgi:phosphoenolpyruvate synthase/pyruvate phosphate dikinase
VDLLSHIAIRARNTNVLLASVADDALWANVIAMNGEHVRCSIVDEALVIEKANVASASQSSASPANSTATKVTIKPYTPSESWVIAPDAYDESIVGGKSKSLAEMSKELAASGAASGVDVPGSFALPFGTFERALAEDTDTRAQLDDAIRAIDAANTASERRDALAHAREIIATQLVCPRGLEEALTRAAKTLNADADMERVWDAVCGVWASKWTERAWLSRKSCGIPDADLNVAVLLMELVDAEFAFVLHTANPVNGDADQVFGELCVGLGETLVGNDPGCALGFTVSKSTGAITIRSVPSKLQGHFAPAGGTIIARSDSNGEDLEDFAGAGLYDSITAEATEERVIDYASSALVWDAAKRDGLITRIAEAAKAIEAYRGAPQDIEGAVVGDRIVLLQTRAQIC